MRNFLISAAIFTLAALSLNGCYYADRYRSVGVVGGSGVYYADEDVAVGTGGYGYGYDYGYDYGYSRPRVVRRTVVVDRPVLVGHPARPRREVRTSAAPPPRVKKAERREIRRKARPAARSEERRVRPESSGHRPSQADRAASATRGQGRSRNKANK
ncbi:MAG: hypothetical protein LBP55_08715 [Candidatus Adiutrix sp.]|jgi:hypothetical protein|nr:hypothetical protein [Candidatus Adiutrix sp.]